MNVQRMNKLKRYKQLDKTRGPWTFTICSTSVNITLVIFALMFLDNKSETNALNDRQISWKSTRSKGAVKGTQYIFY